MELVTICELFDEAVFSLSRSVRRYWPSNGDCEIAEANQVMHLASVLQRHQWHCWAEAHWNKDSAADLNSRLDLLAWHEPSKSLLMVEAKRLYSRWMLRSLVADVRRLNRFSTIAWPDMGDRLIPARRFAAVTATTWEDKIVEWWEWDGDSPDPSPDPWESGSKKWRKGGKDTKRANKGTWQASPLGTRGDDGSDHRHHMLYALWPLS